MAYQNRRAIAQLIAPLIQQGNQYNFYQAIRYLKHIARNLNKHTNNPFNIKVLPELSLAFTRHDISAIDYDSETEDIEITATFLGLYGTASPLPNFYTEQIIQELSEDITVSKDFLDMFHQLLYQKLYAVWRKYRFNQCAFEDHNQRYIKRLYCLIGMADNTLVKLMPNPKSLIKYIGLFSQHPRSSKNLEILLKDYFDIKVKIHSSTSSLHQIATDQRLRLGADNHSLGKAYLGEQVRAYGTSIKLEITSLSYNQFNLLSYDRPYAKALAFLINFFCGAPVKCLVSLSLQAKSINPCQLGSLHWSNLGQNTWIAAKATKIGAVSYTIS